MQKVLKVLRKMFQVIKQQFNIRSIRFKLISAFLIPVVFIILLGYVCYKQASQGLIKNYESNSMVSLDMMGEYYELGLTNISSKATSLVTDEVISKYFSGFYKKNPTEEAKRYSETERKLNAFHSADKFISSIYVFSSYGNPISTASTFDELQAGFYEDFNQSEDAVGIIDSTESSVWKGAHPFLDSQFPDIQADYCLTFMKKLNNSAYKQVGYVIVDIENSFVMDLLKKTNFGDNSLAGFITNDGKAVLNGSCSSDFDLTKESFYQKALTEGAELGSEYVDYQNAKYLFIYTKLTIGNATVFALIPQSVVVKEAEYVKKITIYIVLISCLIALIVGFIISYGIGKVIQKTNHTLSMVATGDLTVDASLKRKDEFSILGKSINHMLTSMRSLIQKMLGVSKSTAVSACEVGIASETLLESSKSIVKAVTDIEQGVQQQASDAENCLRRMADLAHQINMVQDNTVEIGHIADNTKNSVKSGLIVINDLSSKAKDTSDITQLVIDNIESLEAESESIIGIISAINEITEQTNLLSLNATIEAARVGAAGRGFAVVADEIRKLADKSAKESGRIAAVIEKIQDRTKRTVNAAKKAESIVATQENALMVTMKTFDDINSHVENLTGNLTKISSGIDKIGKAKDDTLSAIESISATLEETVAATTEVSSTAENQLSAVEQLNHAALKLGDDAKNLEDTVRVFRII
jgi:methyl-accepting chemotaxis protein